MDRDQLTQEIKSLAPWHHNIELFDDFSTGKVFSPSGLLKRAENDGVSLISPKNKFLRRARALYPKGMFGKTFLDCACNGGAYCFWARELGCDHATGFDVRDHWINQAEFVRQHRTAGPTDNVEFHVLDIYDVPERGFEPADFTYFSGIFYHLPAPIHGLKIAADLTKDVILVNTSMVHDPQNPKGMALFRESTTKMMSGVHELSWWPTSKETLRDILGWMGFNEMKVTMFNEGKEVEIPGTPKASRIEIIAAREKGRLANLDGELLE